MRRRCDDVKSRERCALPSRTWRALYDYAQNNIISWLYMYNHIMIWSYRDIIMSRYSYIMRLGRLTAAASLLTTVGEGPQHRGAASRRWGGVRTGDYYQFQFCFFRRVNSAVYYYYYYYISRRTRALSLARADARARTHIYTRNSFRLGERVDDPILHMVKNCMYNRYQYMYNAYSYMQNTYKTTKPSCRLRRPISMI